MRHLTGLVLAVALAAAVFFGAAWGYLRLLTIPVTGGGAATLPAGGGSLLHDSRVLYAIAALAGTALLAGVCVCVRWISPLAAGLPGLVLIAWTIVYGFNVARAVRSIPLRADAFGTGFEAMGFNGLLAAAGLVLIVPLFIPSRWRSPAGAANPVSPYTPAPYTPAPYTPAPYTPAPYTPAPDTYPPTAATPPPSDWDKTALSDWDKTAPYPTAGDTGGPYGE